MVMVVCLTVIGLYLVLLCLWLVRESGEASRERWLLPFDEAPAAASGAATTGPSTANDRREASENTAVSAARSTDGGGADASRDETAHRDRSAAD